MTKVNFYQVKGDIQAVIGLSCQLAEKAWQMNNHILIYCPDENTAEVMSEHLWSWSAASFLPHKKLPHEKLPHKNLSQAQPTETEQPETIQILTSQSTSVIDELTSKHHGLLINLAADTPDWFSRFELLCEFVYGDETAVAHKRNRYKFYKGRGYPLNYHDMSDRF